MINIFFIVSFNRGPEGLVPQSSRLGTLPEVTEWDCSESSVGLVGGVTWVLVDIFLDLGFCIFLESAPKASAPCNLAKLEGDIVIGGVIIAFLLSNDEMAQESDDTKVFAAGEDINEDTQADEEEHQSPPPNADKPEPFHAQETKRSSFVKA
nr:hypothetical protein [Tanacetum cinerariifolium]